MGGVNKVKIPNISLIPSCMFWSVFLFIFTYAPPLIPYMHLLLGVFVLFVMIFTYNRAYAESFQKSNLSLWIKVMIGVFLYVLIIPLPLSAFYNDIVDLPHYYHLFNRFSVLIFMEATCTTFLLARFKIKKYSFLFFINLLIGIAFFQSILGCLALAFPEVKSIFLTLMTTMGSLSTEKDGLLITRTFGFAGSMLDQFGLGTGLIAGISFFLGVNYKRRYIWYSLFIMISAVLNSRTGIVIYIIGILVTVFSSILINKNIKMMLKTLIFMFLIPMIFAATLEVVSTYSEATGEWVSNGVESVIELIETGNSTKDDMGVMTSDRFWQLPDAEHILIGTGHSRYEAEGYLHTDCGIVNDIWFVGILGLFLLYGIVVFLCFKIFKNSNEALGKFIALFFLCSFFVFDIKGATIGYNMGGAVFFLVLFATRFYQQINLISKE